MISQGNDCDKIHSGGQYVEHIERAHSNPDEKNASTSFSASTTSTSDRKVTIQKPVRPLTAYHLFFQLEREYIIQTSRCDGEVGSQRDSERKNDYRPIGREIDDEMPFRYRYIHLSPHWYASGSGKRLRGSSNQAQEKRKHRKTHGIGFLELSRMISIKWSQLEQKDMEIKNYVSKIASRELALYKRDMEWYKSQVDPDFRRKKDSSASVDSRESLNSQASSPEPPALLDLAATRLNKVAPEQVAKPVAGDKSYTRDDPCNVRKHATNESTLEEFTFHPVPSSQMPESYRRMKRHAASAPPIRHNFNDSYGHNKSDKSIPLSGQINPPATFRGNEQYYNTMINEPRNQFPLGHRCTDGNVVGDVIHSDKRKFKRRNSSSPYQRRDVVRTISDYGVGINRVDCSLPLEEDVSATDTTLTFDDAMDLMKALAD